jgi:hypothetical protein
LQEERTAIWADKLEPWLIPGLFFAMSAVWVMEPKGLPAFLNNAPQRLAAEDVKLAAYHLSRYVRSVERERVAQT